MRDQKSDLGPFSRHVIEQIDQRNAELDDEPVRPLPMAGNMIASIEAAE